MNTLDLNISNYSLEELLNIFKLPLYYTSEDLRKAKQIVLRMHPDKCRHKKEYFLFFSAAYKLLFKVYEFRHRTQQDATTPTNYHTQPMDEEREHSMIWETFAKQSDFNKKFNQLFEETIETSLVEDGYGEWFKQMEDLPPDTIHTVHDMNEHIYHKKQTLRDVSVYKGVSEVSYGNVGTNIDNHNDTYQSELFSGLPYNDLKQVYTETVIPVTDDDFTEEKKRMSRLSMFDINRERDLQHQHDFDNANHETQLKQIYERDMENNTQRAFTLLKQDEYMRNKMSKAVSKLLNIRL